MTIVILEDEPLAARQLAEYIGRSQPDARMLATLAGVGEAVTWFGQHPAPDLLFSDIELLDGNVFALYDRVPVTCPIIFTTAYDQFLLRAFQTNGIAYLLKPFTYESFDQAFTKYKALRNTFVGPMANASAAGLSVEVLTQLRAALQGNQTAYRQRFTVKLRTGIYLLAVDDIVCLQADEGVVFAFDTAGRKYPLNGSLTEIEAQLDPARFFRLNRSDMVQLRHVERLENYVNDRLAVRVTGRAESLIASTARTPELRRWVEG
jgi:two-component system, LytTR family, response regulator LytT